MTETSLWLSDAQFARLSPLLSCDTRGVPRVDDRRVISGILHVLRSGAPVEGRAGLLRTAQDALRPLRPPGGEGGLGEAVSRPVRGGRPALRAEDRRHAREGAPLGGGRRRGGEAQAIGRSLSGRTAKIHAAVDEGGRPRRLIPRPGHRGDAPVAAELIEGFTPQVCLADAASDSNALRAVLSEKGATPVIPNDPARKRPHPFDREAYRRRNAIERTFRRLKDRRRVATRYDRLATNFLAPVTIAAIVSYWL